MGGLHEGHLNLVNHALTKDHAVVSIYVNPSQFGENEDFSKYPRTLEADLDALASVFDSTRISVFAPQNLYDENHMTWVVPEGLDANGEGISRPGHFRGVATVVLKLLNLVQPDCAYFGQKDGQQSIVVKSLCRDLDVPVKIQICETIRESDGLARSTRNRYLSPEQRKIAPALYDALQKCVALAKDSTVAQIKKAFEESIPRDKMSVQYISVASNLNGRELDDKLCLSEENEVLISAAVSFPGSNLRIIDNIVLNKV